MSNPVISAVRAGDLQSLQKAGTAGNEPAGAAKGTGFTQMLTKAINDVDKDLHKADEAVEDLAVGRRKTLHETMITVEQADISFKMMMAVRTKVVNAYQEIMRMQF